MSESLRPDLLREHRLALGLPASPPPLRPARGLLLLGGGLGVVVVLTSLAVYQLLSAREQALQQQVDTLASVEQRVQRAQARLARVRRGSLRWRCHGIRAATARQGRRGSARRSGAARVGGAARPFAITAALAKARSS